MISKVVLGCCLVTSLTVQALPLTDIQWSDKNLADCVNQTATKNAWTDTVQVLKLKCHSAGIKRADELLHFTSLLSLSLYNNRLEELDLRSLKQLKTLNLANNRLQKIQLTGLENLGSLYLFRNQLTTVDLTGLSSLKVLRIMQNQLLSIDIRPLKALEKAYLFDNQLEDLPITGLDKLRFLDVKQNPMPDELYDFYDEQDGIVISHDGNADDWQ